MKIRLCLVAMCCLMFQYQLAFGQTQKVADWEYKQLRNPSDEYLNYIAKEGWEVSAAAGGSGESNSFVVIIVKRPRTHRLFGTKMEETPKPEPPPSNTSCKLSLAQAPVIRGLRLGMTSDELFALFPANERETFDRAQRLKSAELAPNYGYSTFGFSLSNYATQDRYKGIRELSFRILDNKIVSVRAEYSDTPLFDGIEQLMAVITKQYSLPDYKEWPGHANGSNWQTLSCNGFRVQVNVNSNSNFSIEVSDPSYQKIIEDRKKADLAKKREGFQL